MITVRTRGASIEIASDRERVASDIRLIRNTRERAC